MTRFMGRLSLCLLFFFSLSAAAQVATFNGTISNPAQKDSVTFDVDAAQYHTNAKGGIGFVFVMSSGNGSVDPGLISVDADGSGAVSDNLRNPDTPDSTASVALAALTGGRYRITVCAEHKTTGAYRLDVLLAGDANNDSKVDAADLAIISDLNGKKAGDAQYNAAADVDRNGVINGGDRQRAQANLGASAPASTPPDSGEENPLELSLPMNSLQLVGGSSSTFVSSNGLQFSLTGADFDTTAGDVVLTINGSQVPASSLTITEHLLSANIALANGKNVVSLKAYDTVGRPLYYNGTLWAGSSALTVRLINPDGTAFTQQATVLAILSDDQSVRAELTTTSGLVTFPNMPARTILIKAKGASNQTGSAGIIGTSGSVTVKMNGFKPVSSIQNNDFSLGTAGWETGTSPVAIVSHQEEIFSFFQKGPAITAAMNLVPSATSLVDQDLQLNTSGEGEQSVSRTFAVSEGTTAVRIRYRFITTEVPGGYYGSQFNDYFRVSLRTQQGGGSEGENTAMNSLPISAFTGGGSTDWREVTLNVD